jgi:transcriptional/translational regulatory protein YebC/TACO1
MSGHSKWATTKHKKAVVDAKRGKLFARLIKNIEVAAKTGGGDVNGNPTLFDAVQKAKKNSVPADNITNAIKRGSGADAGGADWQTIMYEGYGPNGVAFLIECLTDNRNRAASEVRVAMTRNGGQMADPGSEVVSEAVDLIPVRTALQAAGIDYESAESSFLPSVQVQLDEEGARKVFRLIDALEDSDDVQNVYANFDVSDEVMAAVDA